VRRLPEDGVGTSRGSRAVQLLKNTCNYFVISGAQDRNSGGLEFGADMRTSRTVLGRGSERCARARAFIGPSGCKPEAEMAKFGLAMAGLRVAKRFPYASRECAKTAAVWTVATRPLSPSLCSWLAVRSTIGTFATPNMQTPSFTKTGPSASIRIPFGCQR
jgi:hypothetical protein